MLDQAFARCHVAERTWVVVPQGSTFASDVGARSPLSLLRTKQALARMLCLLYLLDRARVNRLLGCIQLQWANTEGDSFVLENTVP